MGTKVLNFAQLDKLIEEYKENPPLKKGFLILKSGCAPYRGKEIPIMVAQRIVNAAKSGEELLAQSFETEENEEMFIYHDDLAKGLGTVIKIAFKIEEE